MLGLCPPKTFLIYNIYDLITRTYNSCDTHVNTLVEYTSKIIATHAKKGGGNLNGANTGVAPIPNAVTTNKRPR